MQFELDWSWRRDVLGSHHRWVRRQSRNVGRSDRM